MTLFIVKKLACPEKIAEKVLYHMLGFAIPGQYKLLMVGIDIAATVGGAISGGATVFVKKAMEIGLKQAVKKLVAKQGMKAAVSF